MTELCICSRCGRAVRDGRRFGVLLDGGLSVERPLCRRCTADVLELVADALRPPGQDGLIPASRTL